MTLKSPLELAAQIQRLSKAMDDRTWHPVVGAKMKQAAVKAVVNDLGDRSMSGWWRKKVIEPTARWESEDDGIVVTPTRRDLGPWRVLEEGRRGYNAGQFRRRGTRGATKNRGATSRLAIVKRNVGTTSGKETWTDATVLMGKAAPAEITKAKVNAVRKAWR